MILSLVWFRPMWILDRLSLPFLCSDPAEGFYPNSYEYPFYSEKAEIHTTLYLIYVLHCKSVNTLSCWDLRYKLHFGKKE